MSNAYEQFKELCRKIENAPLFEIVPQIKLVPKNKKGSKIYIKKKNRGKFTESAKRAGRSVQEHAIAILNDPDATPLQKKRANFARNAAKWNK